MIGSGDIIVGNGNPAAGVSTTIGTVKQTGGSVQVAGNLVIAASANATGTYNLGGGVLDLTDGQLNFGAGIAAFNFTGGRLQGANTVNTALTQLGGVFAVGGTLTAGGVSIVNNNYSLQAGGTLEFNITAGVADQLVVNGAVTLGGGLDIVGGSAIPVPGRIISRTMGAIWSQAFLPAGQTASRLPTTAVPIRSFITLATGTMFSSFLNRHPRRYLSLAWDSADCSAGDGALHSPSIEIPFFARPSLITTAVLILSGDPLLPEATFDGP